MSAPRSTVLTAGLAAILILAAASATMLSAQQSMPVYKDARRPVAERVADLLGRMTLEEKVAQLTTRWTTLKPLQDAKDWAGMIGLLDTLISQVEPTSYDMALILDMKAKLYIQQNQYSHAIEPWEKALQLSDQFKYFDGKRSSEIVHFLAQLRLQASGVTAEAPQALWF